MADRNLWIFISSPGDVGKERVIAPSKTDVLVCILWSRLGTASRDRTARLWPYFATTQGLIDDARGVLPRKTLSADQRARFFLDAD